MYIFRFFIWILLIRILFQPDANHNEKGHQENEQGRNGCVAHGTDGEKIRQVLILSISQYNAIFDKIKLRLLINDAKIAFYWDFYTLIEKYLLSLHRNRNIMGL